MKLLIMSSLGVIYPHSNVHFCESYIITYIGARDSDLDWLWMTSYILVAKELRSRSLSHCVCLATVNKQHYYLFKSDTDFQIWLSLRHLFFGALNCISLLMFILSPYAGILWSPWCKEENRMSLWEHDSKRWVHHLNQIYLKGQYGSIKLHAC